jgi:hypothetical protein
MNKVQENKMTMFFAVESALQRHSGVWTSHTALADAVSRFQQGYVSIEVQRNIQEQNRRGVTLTKQEARDRMELLSLTVAMALVAYGRVTHDLVLQEQFGFSISDFSHVRDTAVLDLSKMVRDGANVRLGVLGPFGITSVKVAELTSAIGVYESLIGETRGGQNQVSAATEEIERLIREVMGILSIEMDGLLLQFHGSTFYAEYNKAREVIDL